MTDTRSALLLLGRSQIEDLVDLEAVIDSQRRAFIGLAEGTAQLAPRLLLAQPGQDSVAFCYTARLSADTGPVCKFGSVNPGNGASGLPSVSALVLVLDAVTGQPRAVIDGEAITTARTPAASSVAAQALARPGPHVLAVLGCGVQGRAHVRALHQSLDLTETRIWSPSDKQRGEVAGELAADLDAQVRAAETIGEAVRGASIIVTATTSADPLLPGELIDPGATILAVGSFAPDRREYGDDVVRRADVIVVDHVETAMKQAGPLVHATASAALDPARVVSLGDVLIGRSVGRTFPEQVVLYNSVGLGIQDAAAAWLVLDRAVAAGAGTRALL